MPSIRADEPAAAKHEFGPLAQRLATRRSQLPSCRENSLGSMTRSHHVLFISLRPFMRAGSDQVDLGVGRASEDSPSRIPVQRNATAVSRAAIKISRPTPRLGPSLRTRSAYVRSGPDVASCLELEPVGPRKANR